MKKLVALLLALLMAASFVACSSGESMQAEETATTPFDLTAYKALVSDSVASIYNSATLLSNTAQYENNYWKALESVGGVPTSEEIVSSAMEWLEGQTGDNLETLQAQYDENSVAYKEIVSTDTDGSEAETITETYKEYFDAYMGMYNLVTAPSGSRDAFIEEYNSYSNTITNCKSKLEILLT